MERWGSGILRFHVSTASSGYAWIDRTRVCVPNYGDTEHRYTVKTNTYFPGDTFFLCGYADDYIDDVMVEVGLIWHDWQWNSGSYGTLYAWRDGFMYPLEWQSGTKLITFTYGEILGAGVLDFRYVSWTHEQTKLGKPKFYCKAENPVVVAGPLRIDVKEVYGSSKWDAEAGTSGRSISATYNLTVYLPPDSQNPSGHSAKTAFTVSLLYLDYESPKGTTTDFAVAFNMTHLGDTGGFPLQVGFQAPNSGEYGVYVYAPSQAESIIHMEQLEGRSFVDNNFVVNLASDVGYVLFAALIGSQVEFGASYLMMLAGARTLATMVKFTNGQQLPHSGEVGSDPYYRRLWTDGYYFIPEWEPPPRVGVRGTRSDIAFLQTKAGNGMHCGALKVVVVAKLWFTDWGAYPFGTSYPVKIPITFIVPYFVKN